MGLHLLLQVRDLSQLCALGQRLPQLEAQLINLGFVDYFFVSLDILLGLEK